MKIVDNPSFCSLSTQVGVLFRDGSEESFFSLPEWYDLIKHYCLQMGWQVRLYSSETVAAVFCYPNTNARQELHSCVNLYTVEHSFLVLKDCTDPEKEARLFTNGIVKSSLNLDYVLLSGLDPNEPSFFGIMKGLKENDFSVRPYLCWATWYEDTKGHNFESYLAKRPSQLRNTWKRKLSALENAATVSFRIFDSVDVEGFISDYEGVCRRSWKDEEPFKKFIPQLIRMADQKSALRTGVLVANDQAIAAQFWISWKGRATIFKLAYDVAWKKYSPGTLLTMKMIQSVLELDRPDEINFGRGNENYKKLWMSSRRECWGIEAANSKTFTGRSRRLRIGISTLRDRLRNRPGPNLG